MQARDVMTSPVLTVKAETPVAEVAAFLLEHRISAAPVEDENGRMVGIVSEGDLMRRPETGTERHASWWLMLMSDPRRDAREYLKSHGLQAKDVMSLRVVTVAEDTPLDQIADQLEKHGIKRVPVLKDGKVVGIVSRANLLRALVARPQSGPVAADDRALREAVMQALRSTGARTLYVNVVVSEGVVHLWGMAYSNEEREALRVAAQGVPGSKGVQVRINVMPRGTGSTG